ncbi:MAG: sirohydrochlorin cobaltochelatase [Muricoprocola sp.]
MEHQTKAILVVSFGTSYTDAREKNIDRIEQEIQNAFPDHRVYRAWTSRMIARKLKNRDGIVIDSIEEAMDRMKKDGILEVIVQPTHVMNAIENEGMLRDVRKNAAGFTSVKIGAPLLTSQEDYEEMIQVLKEEWKEIPASDVLILMGHGTSHEANAVYALLDARLKESGFANFFIGTVEASPSLEAMIGKVKGLHPKKVHLAPFMIVAGDHARNDMAGEGEDSWANQFRSAGYEVVSHLKGLGEYSGVRKMFIRHVREAQ